MPKIVYLIAGGGYTKVGSSSNLDRRLHHLQVASPHQLRVVATAPGGVRLERGLVWVMSRRYVRARGEWYEGELTVEEAEEVLSLAARAQPGALAAADARTSYTSARYASATACRCPGLVSRGTAAADASAAP